MSDQTSSTATPPNYIALAADIVAAFVSNNSVQAAELPALIANVRHALQNVANPAQPKGEEKATPAVPVKKSITPDGLISLLDGKKYKTLKRHLTRHGLTSAQYRARFGLPADYPMVAPAYAQKRSELARSMGLSQGRQRVAAKSAATSETISAKAAKKRGRKKAA